MGWYVPEPCYYWSSNCEKELIGDYEQENEYYNEDDNGGNNEDMALVVQYGSSGPLDLDPGHPDNGDLKPVLVLSTAISPVISEEKLNEYFTKKWEETCTNALERIYDFT